MTTRLMIPCDICKYYKEQDRCEAFPEGIPDEIYFLGFDHRKEFPNDRGIRFEIRISCSFCKYYMGNEKCQAFKEGIPKEILLGRFIHDKEYPGDRGYRFVPSKKLLNMVFRRINKLYKRVLSLSEEERKRFLAQSKEHFYV